MKSEILKLLRESEGYVSGQQLCEHFGVSRTAVWKVINQLKEEGYQIEAVRNKGYHIVDCSDIMSREELQSQMNTVWAGREIAYFEETDSTNTQAKKLGDAGAPHGTLAVADKQCAGKGRRGRGWDSPSGSGIFMSILLRPDMEPSKAPMLTLVMAVSVAQAVCETEGVDTLIKWPNDIVVNGKKVCGILTEMSTEVDFINHVVIGVGINVNTGAFPEEIAQKATSLRLEMGHPVKRSPLIASVMHFFEVNYEQFQKVGNLSFLQETYNRMLVNRDRDVRILAPGNEYNAHAIGINEQGELLVRRGDGRTEAVYSGEVSVRGIYGYV
ncbi:biotin--[acetyl-CoA-carboxylase] ligase [Hespellia stercorisuis]|uniref:Bifunctional ligase/repressor BirA n=1 Tax=Hespellia stercorisuis DSM 15480 TaxID=1121950 RepID=A0A1M6NFN5_9FIRM|nr:biotin--[acetyl-CoA-carboxylase] ligase [Hespellia stercorisuis]SHJ94444.1 BirA family transcriptional regulator, biotin operon repressor / biotin-[acetyl-CoA-carboxylase] ligase [Hespellia stercorisuis DSM 15480]